MQLIFAGTLAVLIGFAVHALLPDRALTGVLLLPAVAGAACAIVWVVLVWCGAEQGGGPVWAASLVCAALSAAGLGVPLRKRRRLAEERRLAGA